MNVGPDHERWEDTAGTYVLGALPDDETAAERLEAPDRVEDDVARRDEAATVRRTLDILPADQLKVIELAYFGGYTHVEISDMLESPIGTVKGRMRLGLKKMREALSHGAVEA